ncbi:MAG: hypothetical protein M1837_001939 [Sclerophora amabilis]|nr:MAG: hypothetical protein M1837_001939 [Sclerophora amabilis]
MASEKKTKATDEELSKLFEGIDEADTPAKASSKSLAASKAAKNAAQSSAQSEQDLLAELGSLAKERPGSRSQTPGLSSPTASGTVRSPKRGVTGTPPLQGSARTSEDTPQTQAPTRRSAESGRSLLTGMTPAATQNEADPQPEKKAEWETEAPNQGGVPAEGGWWGGLFKTASAAVKTAEAAVKEIQQNEETKRWAEQVKGNVGALRGFGRKHFPYHELCYCGEKADIFKGGELRSRALPTFTNILHTLAPPISSHERLQIHITHDFIGYPSLDPLIYQTFSRVMAQVEGGDLMVIQRGHEASPRRGSDAGVTGSNSGGWNDGPWWRQSAEKRDLAAVKGLVEGTKLARVSAESYSNDFYGPRGGVEEAAKKAAEVLSESNPVRGSDIFLSIQAISHADPEDQFGGRREQSKNGGIVDPDQQPDELISFAIYLFDPVHTITFHTVTQAFPQKWVEWLDATPAPKPSETPISPSGQKAGEFFGRPPHEGGTYDNPTLPDEIAEIIASGGVDPREWVAEWVEEVISLGIGVVAQRYVARRMGVGQGGLGRGKAREEALDSGAGEAARAI